MYARMRLGKVMLAGSVVGVLKVVWGFLTCGCLFNWVYSIEPTSIWKTPEQLPFVFMNIVDIASALLLALVYALIHKGLPGRGVVKGLWFGFFLWLVEALPGNLMLGMVTVMAKGVVIYWILDFLVLSLWQGLVIAAIYGEDSVLTKESDANVNIAGA